MRLTPLLLFTLLAAWLPPRDASAICAEVRLQILQELTLESQAFDATLGIDNPTEHALEGLHVTLDVRTTSGQTVTITSDPSAVGASFFVSVHPLSGLDAVDGTQDVAPGSEASVRWRLIPAPGAGGDTPSGRIYLVGATIRYEVDGQEQSTEVVPDAITVRPKASLRLDYFLPEVVNGDNPFTLEVEPPLPFSLGLRVSNDGLGTAHDLAIQSSQPRIVDNEQGLLVGFEIIGSMVDGQPVSTSLLADLGDIRPGEAGVARWVMTSTLQGRFEDFTANFEHRSDLGGQVTSIFDAVRTRLMRQDVLVGLPGRDDVRDFLAFDQGGTLRVYESNGQDSDVTDQSGDATVVSSGPNEWQVQLPPTTGLLYARLGDPEGGQKRLFEVRREDGRILDPANARLARTWDEDLKTHHFYVDVFDWDNPGLAYTLTFIDKPPVSHPPVLHATPDRSVRVGETLSYPVVATDPDDDPLDLLATPLPPGAAFVDQGAGNGVLTWTPTEASLGEHPVVVQVSDGGFVAGRTVTFTVVPADTDNAPPVSASAVIVTVRNTASDPVQPMVDDPDQSGGHDLDIVTQPQLGEAAAQPEGLVYMPAVGFTGEDSFTFEVTDAFGESVTGTAEVKVLGGDDLRVTALTAGGDALTAVVEHAGPVPTVVPVTLHLLASGCEGEQVVDTRSIVLDPGGNPITFSWDPGALPAGLFAWRVEADPADAIPEPDEWNNSRTLTDRAWSIEVGGSTVRHVCRGGTLAVTLAARADAGACRGVPATGLDVSFRLQSGDGDGVLASAVGRTDDRGVWHGELALPDGQGLPLYELVAVFDDGVRTRTHVHPLTTSDCAPAIPPPLVPEPAFPGPEDGPPVVTITEGEPLLPWVVHPGLPVATEGPARGGLSADGLGAPLSEGPAPLATNSGLVEAGVAAVQAPAEGSVGEPLVLAAIVQASGSIYGLPVRWQVTLPGGEAHPLDTEVRYSVNGHLTLATTWTPRGPGEHVLSLSLGDEWQDGDPADDAAEAVVLVGGGAPASGDLALWLEPDGIVTEGDAVVSWADNASAGAAATQASPAVRPGWRVGALGERWVTFDDGQHLDLPATSEPFDDGLTLVVALRPRNDGGVLQLGGPSEAPLRLGGHQPFSVGWAADGQTTGGVSALAPNRVHVVAVHHSAGHQVTLRRDGTPLGTWSMHGPGGGERLQSTLGAWTGPGVASLDGDVAAVLLYRRALAPAELAAAERYVADLVGAHHPLAEWRDTWRPGPDGPLAVLTQGLDPDVKQSAAVREWSLDEALAYQRWRLSDASNPEVPGQDLSLWLAADRGVTTAGDEVVAWESAGSTSWADAVGTPMSEGGPTLTSGERAAVHFTGSRGLAFPDAPNESLGSTVVLVSRSRSPEQGGRVRIGDRTVSVWPSGRVIYAPRPTEAAGGDAAFVDGRARLVSIVHAPDGRIEIRRNGHPAGAKSLSPLPLRASQPVEIGGAFFNEEPDGELSELLVYRRALSAGELRQVERYLADRHRVPHPEASWPQTVGFSQLVRGWIQAYEWASERAELIASWTGDLPSGPAELALWLRSDQGVTAPGGLVDSWTSVGPEGGDAVPPLVVDRPALDAAAGLVRFEDEDHLRLPRAVGDLRAGITIVAVLEPGLRSGAIVGSPALSARFSLGVHANAVYWHTDGSIPTFEVPRAQLGEASRMVVCLTQSGDVATIHGSWGGLAGKGAADPLPVQPRPVIDVGRPNGGTAEMGLAELIVYRRALGDHERDALLLELANRYELYHPQADWIAAGGFAPDVLSRIHESRWSRAETESWLAAGADTSLPMAGMTLWLRADEGLASGGDGSVEAWQGQAPVASPAVAEPPSFSMAPISTVDPSGSPAVSFGGQSLLQLPPHADDLSQGLTIAVVARPQGVSRRSALLHWSDEQGHLIRVARRGTTDDLRYTADGVSLDAAGAFAAASVRIVVHSPGGVARIFEHGALVAEGAIPLPANALRDQNWLGGDALDGNEPFHGEIAEVIAWRRALSDAERVVVERTLADRYGRWHPAATWRDEGGYTVEQRQLIDALKLPRWEADALP